MEWMACGLLCLFAASMLVPLFPARYRCRLFFVFALISAMSETLALIPVLSGSYDLVASIPFSWPMGTLNVTIDRLSAFFFMIIAWLGLPALALAGRFSPAENLSGGRLHWFFLGLLLLSMKLALITDSLLHFLVVWEIMSLSSFFLVLSVNGGSKTRIAALHYFVAMHISVVFLMLATVLLPVDSRVFSVAHEFSLGGLPFVFLMLGFSFKMGLVPFHSWLPEAYPAAPAHVSALMSSLMSKLGVYGMLRTVLSFGPVSESAAWIVMLLGILSAVSGITFAVIRRDMKEVLSYSSMENLGIITTGIGLMMLASSTSNIYMFAAGLAAVVFHTLCHSLYKIVLFSAAGIIEKAGFGRDLEGMGGIARRMPRISMVFFGMSWASASLPPYGGLISEILLIISLLAGLSFTSPFVTTALILVLALLVMTGAIALLAWTRTWGIAFSGEPRKAALKDIREEWSWGMYLLWIPLLGLLVLGVFPALVLGWVSPVMDHIAMSALHSGPMLAAWPVACLSLTSTLVALTIPLTLFVGLAGLLLVLRWFLLKSRVKASAKTWSCGWQQPDARVQYTASSFSDPFVSVVRPVLHSEKNEQAVAGYFPSQADSHHHDDDPVRRRLVVRLGVLVNAIFARFAWIQSGNMQQYLLYGLIYLVAMIAWVMVVA